MSRICKVITSWIFAFGMLYAAGAGSDRLAGYKDGCSSAKGHYTRSQYKYRYVKAYHDGWRKGKRSCIYKGRSHRYTGIKRSYHCNTEVSWDAFRRGYDDGVRAAKRGIQRHARGCAEYHRGWESGYRSCTCISR